MIEFLKNTWKFAVNVEHHKVHSIPAEEYVKMLI